MGDEILSFIDFFEDYSRLYLVLTITISGSVWLIFYFFYDIPHGTSIECNYSILLFLSFVISAFFDLTTGAANAASDSNFPRRMYAVGSALHFSASPIHMIIPKFSDTTERCDIPLFFALFAGEFLELLAVVFTTVSEENRRTSHICLIVLTLGSFAVLIFLCRKVCSNPQQTLNGLMCGFQIMYIIIVIVAATNDWRRLLWLLPEVPFETISLLLRNIGTEASSDHQTSNSPVGP